MKKRKKTKDDLEQTSIAREATRDTTHSRSRKRQDFRQDSSASVPLHAVQQFDAPYAPLPLLQAQQEKASIYEWNMIELCITKVLWGLQVKCTHLMQSKRHLQSNRCSGSSRAEGGEYGSHLHLREAKRRVDSKLNVRVCMCVK